MVYVDDSLELPPTPARVRPLALQSIRREVGPLGVATAALGAFLQETGAYPVEALARAMKTFQRPAIAETGVKALSLGAGLIRREPPG